MVAPLTPSPFANSVSYALVSRGATLPVARGRSMQIEAQPRGHFKLVKITERGEEAVDRVIAMSTPDNDLVLLTDDGTKIVVRNFFATEGVSVELPQQDGQARTIDGSTPRPTSSSGGFDVLHTYGDGQALASLAHDFAAQYDVLAADRFELSAQSLNHSPLAAGFSPQTLVLIGGALLGGGILAAAGGGSGGAAATATDPSTGPSPDTTAPKTPRLTIDPVTGDNHLSDGELSGAITVSGTATDIADGTSVIVSWGAARVTAVVEDQAWQATFEAGAILATADYTNIYAMTGETVAGAKVTISALERPSLSIDVVSSDDQVTDAERSSGVTVSGVASNVEADSIVVVEWGTTTKSVTPSGTGRWSVTFTEDEIPQDTADATFTVRASVGDFAIASRDVRIAASPVDPEPQIARITIDAVSGDDAVSYIERGSDVTVTGTAENLADGVQVTVSWGQSSRQASVTNHSWSVVFTPGDIPVQDATIHAAAADGTQSPPTDSRAVSVAYPIVTASDLDRDIGGFAVMSPVTGQGIGALVAAAGDVNGDGFDDMLVGTASGSTAYVVFGSSTRAASGQAGTAGLPALEIRSQTGAGNHLTAVSAAGDVNADGLADIAVASMNASGQSGRVYIVFGRTGMTAVQLDDIASGIGGYVIDGSAGDLAGASIAAAGDANQDGFDDIVITSPGLNGGTTHIVYGKGDGAPLDLTNIAGGSAGFQIVGDAPTGAIVRSVASVGDANGDGIIDYVVGTPGLNATGAQAGGAFLVFGRANPADIRLSSIAAGNGGGFVIRGESAGDVAGAAVSAAGDVNGDGLADMFVGTAGSSRAYVVFGRTAVTSVDLAAIRYQLGGFVIEGETDEHVGLAVAPAGDIDGDGFADLIVSVDGGSHPDRAYVVFGKSTTQAVSLSNIAAGNGGFAIEIPQDQDSLSVSAGGDIDGDGLADLLVGAPTASGQPGGGGAYVIYGSTSGAFAHSAFTQTGGVGDDVMSDAGQPAVIAGGAGDDTLSLSRGGSIGLGGAGDDTLVIGIDFLLEGLAGAVNGRISHLDGGSGVDTLKIVGSGIVLDLTALQNPGIGLEHGAGRLSGIERVDLTGSGDNRLKISIEDIIDLSSANVFNAGNGWTGLAATVHDHQMVINGNAGDRVELASQLGWSSGGDATLDGVMYHIVRNASAGTALYIQDGVTGPLTI
ncbi:beta strand repeat-containing protein [Aureimonas altamirensis]|uniref:beta strand repeat-containing protein n=1 Tax=Aureimonas altamirensis TaxID=370622 RepID=UPI0025524177|nr:FG-GAP-like repeat-containing protein [Aureimonas altamirensis]